ncbi:ArsC family reductase [Marinomonas agarivorans]|nr:ArsC family reductase [Marinomonas agarivorans]
MTVIYGIKNCDTMKKAMAWLTESAIEFDFHDYKKSGIDQELVKQWLAEFGWEQVINKRGTTWRNLPEDTKTNMNNEAALACINENPSIIKRPFLVHNEQTLIGFNTNTYRQLFDL